MESCPVEDIREAARCTLMDNRRALRDEEADTRRLSNLQIITRSYIADLAKRHKSKSAVPAAEIVVLQNALYNRKDYVEVVLNTQGALRGLVRELTGQDASRQLAAAGCLCNIVHGDTSERTGVTLVKNAGSYLVTALDSLNAELAITCAWALGNAAGSGRRAAALLTSQGAAARLASAVTSPHADVADAAAAALAQLARQLADDLKKEHVSQILQTLSKRLSKSGFQLLFVLSCHDCFSELIGEQFLQNILEEATSRMSMLTHANRSEFVYLIRTLANVDLNDHIYNVYISHFSMKLEALKNVIKMNIGTVNEALIWFLGNLYNYSLENEFFSQLLS